MKATWAMSISWRSRFVHRLVIVATVLTASRAALAHTVGISRGDYLWKEGTLWVGASFARSELAKHVPALAPLRDGDDLIGFEERRNALGAWLIEQLDVSAEGSSCTASFGGMRFDGDGLALAVSYVCPRDTETIDVDTRFAAALTRGHRHMVALTAGDDQWEAVATDRDHALHFELATPPEKPATSFFALVRMGIEHILTGYDHLLFLCGLVLVGGPLRSLAFAVTAFTVAHSISLALATLHVFAPSPTIVEPGIALSVAYVGIENWFVRDGRGRWRLTFLFGLLHGFGFAGALREIALPEGRLATSLLGFNLGVEAGQLAVLAVLLPLVLVAQKREAWTRVGMRVCTVTVAAAGIVWFVSRLRGGS